MKRLLWSCLAVMLGLAISGCPGDVAGPIAQERPPVDESASPDLVNTAKKPDLSHTTERTATNWSMMGRFPPGVTFSVSRDAKLVEDSFGLPVGKTANDYELPMSLVTPAGARITWMLALHEFDQKKLHTQLAQITNPSNPDRQNKYVAQPWVGFYSDSSEGGRGARDYMLLTKRLGLILTATWPAESGRADAIKVAEQVIATIRPDPTAKKVDLFPGAGEEENEPITPGTEVVMKEGVEITATTSSGTITITAGPMRQRFYTWDGASRSVIMENRAKGYGEGLGYPGPSNHWKDHNGITAGVVTEEIEHFKTEAEALKWIRAHWLSGVYTDDGLLVGWSKSETVLNVEVWQVLIKGKKPKHLPGSNNDRVAVRYGVKPPSEE